RVIGVSKQAVNQAKKRQVAFDQELLMLFNLADQIKEMHPGCGVEKMYYTINPKFIGRDKFCEIFLEYGYRVKKIKNYQRTTYSGETYYKNLIEGMAIRRPFQVIQTDITYFSLNESHYYLVFIIDVYTRQIVGFSVNDNLRLEGNII
ncbi:DDE-type integrase/transposase/recombinase, partial [Arthrospira platensis SPKY2]